MQLLFASTLFTGAFLLFLVQPMVGKMLLPKLGGTPAVWSVCMMFFQAALLAGYGYAHAGSIWLGSRRSALPHLLVLALPALVLPVAIREAAFQTDFAWRFPALVAVAQLTAAVGLPFFVVSTTGPLLQRWFADTGHPAARDPYFLYAASNLGSLLALFAYPALIEPLLPLEGQGEVWALGYSGYAVLVLFCAIALWRGHAPTRPPATLADAVAGDAGASCDDARVSWRRRLRWVLLAFVPSSFLLGATTYISTDLAPIPLLWVLPLAIYLLTFVLVFARKPPISHYWVNRLFPIAALVLTLVLLTGATEMRGLPAWILVGLHLLVFFAAAMIGHGELARDRPAPNRLTEFYLWLSVGGVAGGLFNALLAPIIFHRTGLTEYPLALVLACLIRNAAPPGDEQAVAPLPATLRDYLLPAAIWILAVGLIYATEWMQMDAGPLRTGAMFGLPCVLVYTFMDRPRRFGLGIAALLLAGAVNPTQKLLHLERSFFGVLKVALVRSESGERFRVLYHGNTIHGQQSLDRTDADGRVEPLTYYHRTGPIGHVFEKWLKPTPAGRRIAVVGLGTGSLAWYARAGDDWTFYEIDPAIRDVAENPNYFRFLSECPAGKPLIVVGDARIRLQEAPPRAFDLIVLDAFSSDAIPTHLLTVEAFRLYLDKLTDGGVIALHVSNRYVSLQPILARLAERFQPRLAIRGWHDSAGSDAPGKLPAEWVILARREADFGPLVWPHGPDKPAVTVWEPLRPDADTPLWTDGFSNLLGALK
ncbi:MAG: fused MFS/spermidine synthase [Planctomycetes bacterium]|nr:fused MFS/spermidine synthase [Planctomycetota bacterium]